MYSLYIRYVFDPIDRICPIIKQFSTANYYNKTILKQVRSPLIRSWTNKHALNSSTLGNLLRRGFVMRNWPNWCIQKNNLEKNR